MSSLPVNPRASLMALMEASVPEETNLTISIEGMAPQTFSAMTISSSVGAP